MVKKQIDGNWGPKIEMLATEIAELKMEKNEMTDLTDRLDLAFEFAPDGFVLLDQTGICNYCNKSFGELLGYNQKKIIGKNFLELKAFPLNQFKKTVRLFSKTVKRRTVGPEEFHLTRKNGSQIVAEIITFPIKIYDAITIVLIARDVTERNRTRELLEKSEKRYRTIFETSREAITLETMEGGFFGCNPAALKIFGLSDQKELVSKVSGDLSPTYQPDGELSSEKARVMRKIAEKKGSHFFEWKCKRKDGTEFFSTILLTRFELNGKTVFQAIVRDITNQKLAEQALIERQKELEAKTKDLEEMNAALNVMLKKREEDKKTLEEGVMFNMRRTVEPYLEKLKESNLDRKQKLYVGILDKNLKDIISTFPNAVSSASLRLTPTELEVANLVRQGKTTKQIASALNISIRTAELHRKHVRTKLNLKNKKDNLRTYLLSAFPS